MTIFSPTSKKMIVLKFVNFKHKIISFHKVY